MSKGTNFSDNSQCKCVFMKFIGSPLIKERSIEGKIYSLQWRNRRVSGCPETGGGHTWCIFPCVIQINTKFANFIGLYFPHFTTFRNQTLQFY